MRSIAQCKTNVALGCRNCSASSWPWKASSTRYHVALGPSRLKRYDRRGPRLHPFLDPSFSQILRYIHKLYTCSSRHVISSRRPCRRTSLRGTNVSRTKRKKKQKFMAFRLRKSFDRLVKSRRDALNAKRTRRKKLVWWVATHARSTGGNDELMWSFVSQKRKSQMSSRPSKAGGSSTSHSSMLTF